MSEDNSEKYFKKLASYPCVGVVIPIPIGKDPSWINVSKDDKWTALFGLSEVLGNDMHFVPMIVGVNVQFDEKNATFGVLSGASLGAKMMVDTVNFSPEDKHFLQKTVDHLLCYDTIAYVFPMPNTFDSIEALQSKLGGLVAHIKKNYQITGFPVGLELDIPLGYTGAIRMDIWRDE